jgi:hypothetical protein
MGLPTGPLAYWLNTAKKLVAPVEGRITHNAWIKNPENAAKLGVTVEEAAKAHPDLVTIRQLGRNTDINPMADGAMTDAQLRAISEMVQRLELNPATKVRVGDSVGNLYESPSMMDFLGVGRVKDLPQGYGKGGPVKIGAGGNDFRTPKHAGMSHTFSSAGEPYRDKYGTEMTSVKGENGKYYLRENAGVEAPLLDPMDPFLIPKTAPVSVMRKIAQMARAIPESITHGAQEFARAASPAYVVTPGKLMAAFEPDRAKAIREGAADAKESIDTFLRRSQPTEYSRVEKQIPDSQMDGYSSGGPVDIQAIITAMKAYHNA